MIYQHPLAYLLGVEGAALLRAFVGGYDRDFTEARLSEIRALLDSADQLGEGAWIRPITVAEGYRAWAGRYDQPGNALIDGEQPVVRKILDGLPRGRALDAACGTGRHAQYLASLGYHWGSVLGFDWANQHRDRVAGIAYMEASVTPFTWDDLASDRAPTAHSGRRHQISWLLTGKEPPRRANCAR